MSLQSPALLDMSLQTALLDRDERAAADPVQCADLSRRWTIVSVFGLATAGNAFMWFDYSAIPQIFTGSFGVGDSGLNWTYTIALLATLPSAPLAAVQLERRNYGTMFTMAGLNAVGALLRYLSVSLDKPSYALAMLSSVALGLGTGVILCSITNLACTWFPPSERAFAASVAAQANSAGWALGAVIVPSTVSTLGQLKQLLVIQLLVVVASTVLFGALYRAKPPNAAQPAPKPLDVMAQKSSDKIAHVLLKLLHNRQYVVQSFCYTIVAGVAFTVPAIQAEIFTAKGVSDSTSAWTNFAFIASGVICGVICSRHVTRPVQFGRVLRMMFVIGAAALTVLAVGIAHLDPHGRGFVVFTVCMMTVAGSGLLGFLGIGLQAVSEVAHPVGETYSAGLTEWMIQIAAAILTQVSSGAVGFWLCISVLWIVVPVFGFMFDESCYHAEPPDDPPQPPTPQRTL